MGAFVLLALVRVQTQAAAASLEDQCGGWTRVQHIAGAVIDASDGSQRGLARVKCKGAEFMLLERLQGAGRQVTRETVDVLALPALDPNEAVSFGEKTCREDGRFSGGIIGIVTIGGEESRFLSPTRVWRVEAETDKFREAKDTSRFDCKNPSWGL